MIRLIPFLVVLLASCSHFKPEPENRFEVQRALANVGSNKSCMEIIGNLASRDIAFSESNFDDRLRQLGIGHVINLMDDFFYHQSYGRYLTIEDENSFFQAKRRLRVSTDPDVVMARLTPEDKFVIWNTALKHNDRQVDQLVLTLLAEQGDAAAAFFLRLPAGESRKNAQTALNLMKRIEPETPIDELVRRLEARMLTCVR